MMSKQTLHNIKARLDEALVSAEQERNCSIAVAPNSHGAGYDTGYYDALIVVMRTLNREETGTLPELE